MGSLNDPVSYEVQDLTRALESGTLKKECFKFRKGGSVGADQLDTSLCVLERAEETLAGHIRRLDEKDLGDEERAKLIETIEVSCSAIDGFLKERDHDISLERRKRLYAQMLHRMECADIVRNRGDRREEVRFLEEAKEILDLLRVLDDDISATNSDD